VAGGVLLGGAPWPESGRSPELAKTAILGTLGQKEDTGREHGEGRAHLHPRHDWRGSVTVRSLPRRRCVPEEVRRGCEHRGEWHKAWGKTWRLRYPVAMLGMWSRKALGHHRARTTAATLLQKRRDPKHCGAMARARPVSRKRERECGEDLSLYRGGLHAFGGSKSRANRDSVVPTRVLLEDDARKKKKGKDCRWHAGQERQREKERVPADSETEERRGARHSGRTTWARVRSEKSKWGREAGPRVGSGSWASGQNRERRGSVFFYIFFFSFLFQSFSKRDFKSFLEIEQNTRYKIKYASAWMHKHVSKPYDNF